MQGWERGGGQNDPTVWRLAGYLTDLNADLVDQKNVLFSNSPILRQNVILVLKTLFQSGFQKLTVSNVVIQIQGFPG